MPRKSRRNRGAAQPPSGRVPRPPAAAAAPPGPPGGGGGPRPATANPPVWDFPNAQTGEAVGGGMCQFSNLIHWMVLHAPLTITEQHHHDQFDLFPDFGRQVPFGTGTSIFYNYLDYCFRNDTEQTYQLLVHTTPTHLCGELRTDAPLAVKYHIAAENERFVREDGVVYRCGEVYRTMVDKTTGNVLSRELLRRNHARVLYDTAGLEIMDR